MNNDVDETTRRYFVGLDLGQRQDYTAIAVVERADWLGEMDYATWERKREQRLRVRHLERMSLGTPYPDIVERVKTLVQAPDLRDRCSLVVDATGVGAPVVDMLRRAGLGCGIVPVLITGGLSETLNNGFYGVPKRDLVAGLQVKMDMGTLRIAAELPEAATLVKELMAMQVKVSATGHEGFGAWREGTHDDLVFALALACWRTKAEESAWGTRSLGIY